MIRYTTPSISLTIEDIDLTDKEVYVTLQQGNLKMTKSGADLAINVTPVGESYESNISFTLTQEESAMFDYSRSCIIQANWIDASGVREATDIQNVSVMRNLLDEVIEYGN